MHSVTRFHDISCGHRVVGHEGKCRHLHGHNYRIHFTCVGNNLDDVGRVIDFSVIKDRLCMWLEDNWDHRFLAWAEDPVVNEMFNRLPLNSAAFKALFESVVRVPFNPTAEAMAEFLVCRIGPLMLEGTGVVLEEVRIEETAKCSATFRQLVATAFFSHSINDKD